MSTTKMIYIDSANLKQNFEECSHLGSGADASVVLYRHRRILRRVIAVKAPKANYHQPTLLLKEIKIMKDLDCGQIVRLFGYDEEWKPIGPALFLEYCGLGDLVDYTDRLLKDTKPNGLYEIPEKTLWKFFSDMSKGLDYLHNEQKIVHGDFIPPNILVAEPAQYDEFFPSLPNFKICDFARSAQYKDSPSKVEFWGTYEFAPPRDQIEKFDTIQPMVDTWALGATLQWFALGIVPIQDRHTFTNAPKEKTGVDLTVLEPKPDFTANEWRQRIPVVYRPLNVSMDVLKERYDWPHNATHTTAVYSDLLNRWYAECLEVDIDQRITAEKLVDCVVPVADQEIARLQTKNKA
jgi:serine/threonine protein kinase